MEIPNERFESLVYKALSSEVITLSKAAYFLGQDIEIVNHKLYTYETLDYFKEKHKDDEIYFVLFLS